MEANVTVRLGIDIGGTMTKILVLENGKKVYDEASPTVKESPEKLVAFIVDKYNELSGRFNIEKIGIGVPGTVINGLVDTDNLPMKNTPMMQMLRDKGIHIPIVIDNDANCAALAESKLGKTKYNNLVMLTLGTGVGGGVVLDGEIRRGRGGLGEIGHMVIDGINGAPCICGNRGCFEHYASATALIKRAEKAARENVGSLLHEYYQKDQKLNGFQIFEALKKQCPVAKQVLSEYLNLLAVGIKSVINIFDPDAVVLAGGITKDGDLFIDDLKKRVNSNVEIVVSTLQGEAGSYGAALL